MTAGRICSRTVYLADGEESVQTAARRMQAQGVGTLLVLNEARQPVGILTDRDITTRVVALARAGEETLVREVMTRAPRTVDEETPIEDVLASMRSWGVRRLPVVDGAGRLVGVVTLDDVLDLLFEELTVAGGILSRQRPRGTPPAQVGGGYPPR